MQPVQGDPEAIPITLINEMTGAGRSGVKYRKNQRIAARNSQPPPWVLTSQLVFSRKVDEEDGSGAQIWLKVEPE
jgi:hypothetical protein